MTRFGEAQGKTCAYRKHASGNIISNAISHWKTPAQSLRNTSAHGAPPQSAATMKCATIADTGSALFSCQASARTDAIRRPSFIT